MRIEDLKKLNVENNFRKKFDEPIKARLAQVKEQSLERGRVIPPILVWRTDKVDQVVYGHSLVSLVRENPSLECTVIYFEYKDWQEAGADITTYVCSLEEVWPWHKLVLCFECDEYWYDIEMAKQNKGKRVDLNKDSEFKSQKVNEIIAKKTGLSATTVSNFKAIYFNGTEDLKKKCCDGLGISTAYKMLKSKDDKKSDKKSGKIKDKTSLKIEVIKDCNIFDECEKLPCLSKKKAVSTGHNDADHQSIVDKIAQAKPPVGRIWVTLDRNKGELHLANTTLDEAAGKLQVKINYFDCNFLEAVNGLYYFEADFIAPELYNRKVTDDFDSDVSASETKEVQE